jgi:hypothetical protein
VKELELQLSHSNVKGQVYPVVIFVENHAEILKLIRDRKLTPESYKEAMSKLAPMMKAADESRFFVVR